MDDGAQGSMKASKLVLGSADLSFKRDNMELMPLYSATGTRKYNQLTN
jgi:hypothetical protein